MYRVWSFVANYSLLLIGGAVIDLVWANTDPREYRAIMVFVIIDSSFFGHAQAGDLGHVRRTLTVHDQVNDLITVLLSFVAVIVSVVAGRLANVQKQPL